MCPSTENAETQREFAADVLRNLLRRIDTGNARVERHTFAVSHAWTDGPMIYAVFAVQWFGDVGADLPEYPSDIHPAHAANTGAVHAIRSRSGAAKK